MADKSICNFTGLARCQEGGLIIHHVPGTALGVRDSIQGRCCRLSAAIMQSSLILKSVGVLYTCGLVRDLKITHTHTHTESINATLETTVQTEVHKTTGEKKSGFQHGLLEKEGCHYQGPSRAPGATCCLAPELS